MVYRKSGTATINKERLLVTADNRVLEDYIQRFLSFIAGRERKI
jgi:hypothetical protein